MKNVIIVMSDNMKLLNQKLKLFEEIKSDLSELKQAWMMVQVESIAV